MLLAPDTMFAVPSGHGSTDRLLKPPGQLWMGKIIVKTRRQNLSQRSNIWLKQNPLYNNDLTANK